MIMMWKLSKMVVVVLSNLTLTLLLLFVLNIVVFNVIWLLISY